MTSCYSQMDSPLGQLILISDGEAVTAIQMAGQRGEQTPGAGWLRDAACLRAAREQLQAYFAGELQHFDLPLRPEGPEFAQRVWAALQTIPFGETRSYGDLAQQIGHPGAARAVGAANGRNPISIVVPCHRVIGASGKLTGYAGGLDRKQWLLAHESEWAEQAQIPLL